LPFAPASAPALASFPFPLFFGAIVAVSSRA
jgi:hypothetical protein